MHTYNVSMVVQGGLLMLVATDRDGKTVASVQYTPTDGSLAKLVEECKADAARKDAAKVG